MFEQILLYIISISLLEGILKKVTKQTKSKTFFDYFIEPRPTTTTRVGFVISF
jgi:hypothetical protein